ncbi:class II aldolase/adducin head domain-containing protein [Arcticibacter svalbardensis]|nr:hypothetical protein [Arcticibacter svalbardensis]
MFQVRIIFFYKIDSFPIVIFIFDSISDIPIFGTTHADHITVDVPCAPPMEDEMIEGDYEYQTGFQIMNCIKNKGLSYEEVQMLLSMIFRIFL